MTVLFVFQKKSVSVIEPIEQWYDEPKFISYWTDQIKETFTKIEDKEKTVVIFRRIVCQKQLLQQGPLCGAIAAYSRFNCGAANIQTIQRVGKVLGILQIRG